MGRLSGRIALITGAAAGIGKASAERFAREGAALGLIDVDDAAGQALADRLRAAGAEARYHRADVSEAAQLQRAIDALATDLGGIDVLYNNAGGATSQDGFTLDMPLAEFGRAIGLNLFGTFAACRFAIPHLERRGGGSIVNTASIRAMIGTAGADAYTAAKGGIVTLTRALALQCAPMNIRVNAIAPGTVLTERVRGFMAAGNDSGPDAAMVQRHLLGLGEPDRVASVALFFASDDSRWVTGQVLAVDGGASAN